ncbi:MAG: hypothetical protein K9J16_01605 [Melioribacteraceae bacterium]|nr:hypothetical protein [Melioribacteraceae bacterium]MCF8354841.1 hypothetical protein [Melioribacteraceae bacterium]MCF8392948.1 hypothetical protein [Melioribacteraceae bacterium]MCF8417309.1 hypothetical protein [Melioribacteraceae bacterium]
MVYFILYIVLITELLIVILERDELEEKEHAVKTEMIETIADAYKKGIILDIPNRVTDYNIKSTAEPDTILMSVQGLVSDEEAHAVKYFILVSEDSKNSPPEWPEGGLTIENGTENYYIEKDPGTGNAKLIVTFRNQGEFTFKAHVELERQFPKYLDAMPDWKEELIQEVGEMKEARSNDEFFRIDAKSLGGVKKKEVEFFF